MERMALHQSLLHYKTPVAFIYGLHTKVILEIMYIIQYIHQTLKFIFGPNLIFFLRNKRLSELARGSQSLLLPQEFCSLEVLGQQLLEVLQEQFPIIFSHVSERDGPCFIVMNVH